MTWPKGNTDAREPETHSPPPQPGSTLLDDAHLPEAGTSPAVAVSAQIPPQGSPDLFRLLEPFRRNMHTIVLFSFIGGAVVVALVLLVAIVRR